MVSIEFSRGGVTVGKSDSKKSSGVCSSITKLFNKTVGDLKHSSNEKQLAVGAIAGLTTGYITSKFGKIAATAIGGSLLILQIAKYNKYIDVDMEKIQEDMNTLKLTIDKNKSKIPQVYNSVRDFAAENALLAGGFVSGFLLGFAFS